jgi:hypothetical protein
MKSGTERRTLTRVQFGEPDALERVRAKTVRPVLETKGQVGLLSSCASNARRMEPRRRVGAAHGEP